MNTNITTTTTAATDLVTMKDGQPVTTSLKIAEVFGKPHKDVLKAIRELNCPDDFRERNFSLSEYSRHNGIEKKIKYPMYFVTRDGFTLKVSAA